MVSNELSNSIKEFVLEGIDIAKPRFSPDSDPFWQSLTEVGTEVWLDTGDMDAASEIWTAEMSALTTNNSLLNKEIQKGIYDDLIKEADKLVNDMDLKTRVIEIAFILNARHGLRLVEQFGGKVSVELHTDMAHDIENTVWYGKRFHEICPDHFIIKVPFTAAGLLGARKLHEESIPVNFTLGFSARHNVLATLIAKPHYVNVFLGRINSFLADNNLGSGDLIGEKTTLASQNRVSALAKEHGLNTRQIAASMRSGAQVDNLAGVDVMTIPTKVAKQARENLPGSFSSQLDQNYQVSLYDGVNPAELRLDKLYNVTEEELGFARAIDKDPPETGDQLVERAHEMGIGDIFPRFEDAQLKQIAVDGKIPVHDRWKQEIEKGELALDTLLNVAGLATFADDQASLDARVEGLLL
jgi:transaldolase